MFCAFNLIGAQLTAHINKMPRLGKEEQKQSLLHKRKTKKKIVRNVLATPYRKHWPLVGLEEEAQIYNTLKKHFSNLKGDKVSVPWNIIKSIPKEDRKEFRSLYIKSPAKNYRSHVVFGVNETTKLLEADSASSVLISKDADPQFLVHHIIDLCVLKNISVLVIPSLRSVLKQVLGLPSLSIAFNSNQKHYYEIDEMIKEIYRNHKPPRKHNHFNHECKDADIGMDVSECEVNTSETKNVYLYRKTIEKRAFIPKSSVKRKSNTFNQQHPIAAMDDKDFISIDDERRESRTVNLEGMNDKGFISFDDGSNQPPPVRRNQRKVSYKSLLLKRVSNDKDRDMKKIQRLKMKSK